MKLQYDITDRFDRLFRKCGGSAKAINIGITLLKWKIEQEQKGYQICSISRSKRK